jgi:hypothetical protein
MPLTEQDDAMMEENMVSPVQYSIIPLAKNI